MPRAKKRRYVYTSHTDERIRETIAAAIPEGGILWDYLTEIGMEPVTGVNEFERGKCEGRRELAGELLSISMQPSVKEYSVKGNQ